MDKYERQILRIQEARKLLEQKRKQETQDKEQK